MAYPPPPYADAVCGTFVCGEMICGTWWAYPTTSGLALGATPPVVEIIEGDVVPSAGLALGATAPGLAIGNTYTPPAAGLALGATAPEIRISSIISPPSAGLAFGALAPQAGSRYLSDAVCVDLNLEPDVESDFVLVAAGSSDLVLDSEECL